MADSLQNELSDKTTITDYGNFPLLKLPKTNQTVFVDKEYGAVEESVLRTIIREIVSDEIEKMKADMGLLYIQDNQVYYNGDRLVKASEIFVV